MVPSGVCNGKKVEAKDNLLRESNFRIIILQKDLTNEASASTGFCDLFHFIMHLRAEAAHKRRYHTDMDTFIIKQTDEKTPKSGLIYNIVSSELRCEKI
jgi:hypothetical protein